MTYPPCQGVGRGVGILGKTGDQVQLGPLTCMLCKGSGQVSSTTGENFPAVFKAARERRRDRQARGVSIYDEAAARSISVPMLQAEERGECLPARKAARR